MMRSLRDVRLVPVVLVAAGALFVLKFTGLVTEGSYTLGAGHRAKADRIAYEAQLARDKSVASKVAASNPLSGAEAIKQAWSKETLNYQDVTGSVGATKPAEKKDGKPDADKKDGDKKEATKPIEPKKVPDGVVIPIEPKPVSPAERALLERLTERRQELDARERELSVRETLLQAQEKRLEAKVNELKDVEAKITAATQKKQEAEVAKLKSLVTMYENMKAKEAAKIFERLEIRLATEVANQIAPRRMSDILAQMTPESAERLTVELANKSSAKPQAPDLPKIDGKPGG
jgi:flagellar motility protein MotE (MotC chaperone)